MRQIIITILLLVVFFGNSVLTLAQSPENISCVPSGNKAFAEITDPNTIKSMFDPADFLAAGSLYSNIVTAPVPKTIPESVTKVHIYDFGKKKWARLLDKDDKMLAWIGKVNGSPWNNPIVAGRPFLRQPYLTAQGELKVPMPERDDSIAVKAVRDKIIAQNIEKEKFSFAIFSDTHIKSPGWHRGHTGLLLQSIGQVLNKRPIPDFCIVTGDLDSATGDARFKQKTFHAGNLQNWLSKISLLQMPIYPATGNHDPRYSFRWLILDQKNPTTEPVCYSFNAGKWHMIIMDITRGPDKTSYGPHFQKMANWLENDLEQNKGRPVMVFSHDPMVTITCEGFLSEKKSQAWLRQNFDREKILGILNKHKKVRYVFNGHIHCYELAMQDGITFVSCLSTMGNNYDGKVWQRDKYWKAGWMLVEVDGEDVKISKKLLDKPFEVVVSD